MKEGFSSSWPEKPYRGLNYFRPKDRPLLAGRDADILACAELIGHPETRVLLLHGSTGCGKSSFLRAGLIPAMEDHGAAHLFLHDDSADKEALFIRCTASPIDQIARKVFLFASAPFHLRTPTGVRNVDLKAAHLEAQSWEEYLTAAREENGLVESLRRIASAIPQTLVLIVDQAEEVLTLNPGDEGFASRSLFFSFLREFQRLEFDARIMVALRTEYFGRFLDAIQISHRDATGFRHFFLEELVSAALQDAILRPTSGVDFPPWSAPLHIYKFRYEDGLAERITNDILRTRYSGPALPVLQLVCLGLYEEVTRSGRNVITASDYEATGGIEGQIASHVQRALQRGFVDKIGFEAKKPQLQKFLSQFYIIQDDGTIVAQTRNAEWSKSMLARLMPKKDAHLLLAQLTDPNTIVLRSLRNIKADGSAVDEITLGHDSIALAVERWRSLDAEAIAVSEKKQFDTSFQISGVICILFAFYLSINSFLNESFRADVIAQLISPITWTLSLLRNHLPIFLAYLLSIPIGLITMFVGGVFGFAITAVFVKLLCFDGFLFFRQALRERSFELVATRLQIALRSNRSRHDARSSDADSSEGLGSNPPSA